MEFDPAILVRFAELRVQTEEAMANPDVGEAEVTAIAAAFDQLLEDSGLAERYEQQRYMRRFHARGRAVDLPPPPSALDRWLWPHQGR